MEKEQTEKTELSVMSDEELVIYWANLIAEASRVEKELERRGIE